MQHVVMTAAPSTAFASRKKEAAVGVVRSCGVTWSCTLAARRTR